jgi:uncharacterized iron-regulated membrane protein
MALIRTLHAWAGAFLSLILVVLGVTGSLLVIKDDWIRLTLPEARAAASATPETLGRALDALEAAHPGHLHHVVFPSPQLGVHQVFFHGESYGYAAADGRLVAQWTGTGRVEAWVYELHHFLLSGETGMRVAGAVALAATLLAISGLVIWLPAWRNFGLRWWPRSGKRRDLIAAHRNLGVVFAIPVLVFCLTGGAIIFYQTTHAWLVALMPGPEAEEFFLPVDPGDIDWTRALAGAQAAFPKATLRMVIWPEGPWAPAVVRLKQPQEWETDGRTSVMIDPSTSRVIGSVDPQVLGRGQRLNDAIHPIHAARVGGRLYDAATFLSGLALATLGGLGLWSFLIKPRGRAKQKAAA